jgi:hypothetical protein
VINAVKMGSLFCDLTSGRYDPDQANAAVIQLTEANAFEKDSMLSAKGFLCPTPHSGSNCVSAECRQSLADILGIINGEKNAVIANATDTDVDDDGHSDANDKAPWDPGHY